MCNMNKSTMCIFYFLSLSCPPFPPLHPPQLLLCIDSLPLSSLFTTSMPYYNFFGSLKMPSCFHVR